VSDSIYDRLCPFITDDAVLGKVSWNDGCGAFETAVSLWGTARVPLLLCVLDPIAHCEARLRRNLGARRPTSTAPAELAPALIERGKAALRQLAALEIAARRAAAKPAPNVDPLPAEKLHVGSVQVFSTRTVVWFGSRQDAVRVELDLTGGTAPRARRGAANGSEMPSRVPATILELPTHLHHPSLGDLTLSVRAAQYIGARNGVALRVDLDKSIERKTLDASLERAGALLQKVEPQYGEATERAITALRERRAHRRKAAPASVRLEWAALLDRGEAWLFFETDPPEDDRLSAAFDTEGRLTRININTEEESFAVEVPVAPVAAGAPERVEHPTFGVGVVQDRVEGDKVRVRFGDGVERILLARFLRPKP
jgi:hypothetical protein